MNISQTINQQIRPYILGGLTTSLLGISMIVPLWDRNKFKYSQTVFCFNPPVVYEPQYHHYCQKSKRRIGLSSVVENEKSLNTEFHEKVTLLEIVSAKDANLINIGCAGVVLIWSGYFCLGNALSITQSMRNELAKNILLDANTRRTMTANQMLIDDTISNNKTAQELDLHHRAHEEVLGMNKSANEVYTEQINARVNNELAQTQHQMHLANMGKVTAEALRDKAKADKEREKILGDKDSTSSTFKSTRFELEEKYQWIYKLFKLPFRVLSGEQGSGKSTLERLMIKLLKDDGWHIVIINPETNPAVWSGVQILADADEINSFFSAFPKTIRERQQQARNFKIDEDDYLDYIKDKSVQEGKVAVFLMESNTYEVHGVNPDLWANFLKQSLTNIRKWGYTVCLTAHSDNQTSISTKLQGFSKLIDNAPRVDCIAKTGENGEAVSSGRAMLKMKGVNDKEPDEVSLYNYPKSKKF